VDLTVFGNHILLQNHVRFIEGKSPFMEAFRDLEPEINHIDAVIGVASTIAEFLDTHQLEGAAKQKQALLSKIDRTKSYLQPMLDAMVLEGSYHMATPCSLCPDEEDNVCGLDCVSGSPWSAKIQQDLVPDPVSYTHLTLPTILRVDFSLSRVTV